MLRYVQSSSCPNANSVENTNPLDVKLLNVVLKAVEKAEQKAKHWIMADERTQHDLIFEIGFVLYSDLAKRMCACAFPVHVCVADVGNAQTHYDGVGRMKEYLMNKMSTGQVPTAPGTFDCQETQLN